MGIISPLPREPFKLRFLYLNLAEGKLGRARDLADELSDHLRLADLDYRAGRYEQALADVQSALDDARATGSFSKRAWALQMKGQIELAMGNAGEGRRTAGDGLDGCVKASPIKTLGRHELFLRGMIERAAGRYAPAIDHLQKAVALMPGESRALGYGWQAVFIEGLAQAYFESGDLARSEECYRKIQSLALSRLGCGDIYTTSFYWIGRSAEAGDRTEEARANYRKFLDLWKNADPGHPED